LVIGDCASLYLPCLSLQPWVVVRRWQPARQISGVTDSWQGRSRCLAKYSWWFRSLALPRVAVSNLPKIAAERAAVGGIYKKCMRFF
jgi:hypothetical protein